MICPMPANSDGLAGFSARVYFSKARRSSSFPVQGDQRLNIISPADENSRHREILEFGRIDRLPNASRPASAPQHPRATSRRGRNTIPHIVTALGSRLDGLRQGGSRCGRWQLLEERLRRKALLLVMELFSTAAGKVENASKSAATARRPARTAASPLPHDMWPVSCATHPRDSRAWQRRQGLWRSSVSCLRTAAAA